jgi:hypothetical protein
MMADLRDIFATTVLVGRFNPLIFSPEWLAACNAIGPQEASVARESGIEVIAPNITSINLGSLKLIVEENRFMLTVSEEPLIRAKDFSVTCFRALSHTPVFAVGLNFNATLAEPDLEKWHRFGDTLAPKEPWGAFSTDEDGKRLGGLRSVTMERTRVLDKFDGYTRCTIQVAEAGFEASLQIHNHFELGTNPPADGAKAYKLIDEAWEDVFADSQRTMELVQSMANAA